MVLSKPWIIFMRNMRSWLPSNEVEVVAIDVTTVAVAAAADADIAAEIVEFVDVIQLKIWRLRIELKIETFTFT